MTFFCKLRRVFALGLVLAGLSGCVTTTQSTAPAHVFVTAAGTINYLGASCAPDQLPARLAHNGVGSTQEIRIHMEDTRNTQLRSRIAAGLLLKGYKRILFVAAPRASAEIVGEPGAHVEMPPEKIGD